ncbi:hypothetical protein IGI04_027144 [Brassica rapa subsp. trilocularis]|uniref:Uncharacterized protein n=1 Tax=Brassica rapa subsp. trilocularis TaxID=1813537 RepID=A0ABQ7KZ85_BRACM|nr:hypothetical protein IGI04_027144 [Brassica rapa subsp. trilocularis]
MSGGYYFWVQVSLAASNRIGKEVIETEHGPSQITVYGNSFIAGITSNETSDQSEIVAEADDRTEAVLTWHSSILRRLSRRGKVGEVFRDRRSDLYKVLLTMWTVTPDRF